MNRRAVLECCVDSVESALAAYDGGAMRLEICGSLLEGGLTPTLGLFLAIRRKLVDVFLVVLIRARSGDFVYSPEEVDVMLEDIRVLVKNGANGVVVGALTSQGDVDVQTLRRFIEAAGNVEITFHRAIDVSRDPLLALRACKENGVRRILTSGCAPTAIEGRAKIREFVNFIDQEFPGHRRGEFIVAAGSGVSEINAVQLLNESGADQLHGSFRVTKKKSTQDADAGSKRVKHDLEDHFGTVLVTSRENVEKVLSSLAWREEMGTTHGTHSI